MSDNQLRLVVFGHSHIAAIQDAVKDIGIEGISLFSGAHFFIINENVKWFVPPSWKEGGGKVIPNSAIMNSLQVRGAFSGNKKDLVISVCGGNVHNVYGLLSGSPAIDFLLPESPNVPLLKGTLIIPYTAIRDFIEEKVRPMLALVAAVAAETKRTVVQLESPPPIGCNKFIEKNLDTYFKAESEIDVAPPLIRWKFWRLHSEIVKSHCEKHGIVFMPAPKDAMDSQGFLLPEGYGNATHANKWYGDKVIRSLEVFISGVHSEV